MTKHDTKQQKTDSIIAAMCDDLKPVKCKRPCKNMAIWFVASVILISLIILLLGVRPEDNKLYEGVFLVKSVVLLFMSAVCAYGGFKLGIPDSPAKHRIWAAMCYGALVFWFISLGYTVYDISAEALLKEAYSGHVGCASVLTASASAMAVLMFVMLHDSFPVRPYIIGLSAALASTALSFVFTSYFCYLDTPEHVAFFHMLPVLVITMVFVLLARFFLKK